jgi:serine/threonine protein kinase
LIKLSEQLGKSPQLKVKELQKFVDTMGSNLEESFDLELFGFAQQASIEQDQEGIVRYLVSVVSDEPVAKKCVALEVIYHLLERDKHQREKILAHKLLPILISLLPQIASGSRLNEALGVQILRVIACTADHYSSWEADEAKRVLAAVIGASKVATENTQLLETIGCALAPFYRDRTITDQLAFEKDPIKCLLLGTVTGKARLHREIPASDVELTQEIFQSPLCKVYRGRWHGHDVAVKKFSQYSLGFAWEDFYKEVGLLALAQHPSVVTLHGAYANNGRTEEPFIVLEYLAKGDMHEYVVEYFKQHPEGFPIMRIVDFALDIAKGLTFVHQLGIIHRDIKTANFLIADNMTVKMIDFGVSRVVSSVVMTCVGTPTFMAPEVLSGDNYAASADVYSFAMVMYEIYTGKEPFADVQSLQLAGKVIGGLRPDVPSSTHPHNSGFLQIMQQGWLAAPDKRPNFKQIVVSLYQLKKISAPSAAPAAQAPVPEPAAPLAGRAVAQSTAHSLMPAPLQLNNSGRQDLNGGLNNSAVRSSTNPEDYDWYFGNISKDASVSLLAGKPTGTFLVRSSSREGCYAASAVFDDGVRHILIQPGDNGRYVVDALDNKNYNFKSIPAVVKSYSNILITPVKRNVMETYGTVPAARQAW